MIGEDEENIYNTKKNEQDKKIRIKLKNMKSDDHKNRKKG